MQMTLQCTSLPSSPRDRLLSCANELFALRGYQTISLRDLATSLGVQPGSLYYHIDSKQSLLFELIEDALNELLFCTKQQLKRARNPREKLQKFVRAFVIFKKNCHHGLTLILRENFNLTPDQAVQVERAKYTYLMILVSIIAELNKHIGAPSPLMRFAAESIIGMLFSNGQWSILERDQANAVEMLTHFTEGIIRSCLSIYVTD